MALVIEICERHEWESMVAIFTAMEEHYAGKGVIEKPLMEHYLSARVFAAHSGTTVIRVMRDRVAIGFACVSILYPSPRYSGQMFIKELFIADEQRGQGYGKALMAFIAQTAIALDCRSLTWMSEKSNDASRRFYQALGGNIMEGMHYFSLSGAALTALSSVS